MKQEKLIKDMNYLELEKVLNEDREFTEIEFRQIKKHKNIDDVTFWSRKENIANYTMEILKDNGNLYSTADIFVKENK